MSNKFVTLLDKMGGLFKLGAKKTIAVMASPQAQTIENIAEQGLSIIDPPAGALLTDLLTPIVKIQQTAVALKASDGNGDAKLALVIPEIASLILSEPLFKGFTPKDPALFTKGITELTQGLVDITSSYEAPATPTSAAL